MKRISTFVVSGIMAFSLAGCGSSGSSAAKNSDSSDSKGKQVLNLWSFSNEVPRLVDEYLSLNPDFAAKYYVRSTIISTTEGAYQPALDQALTSGGSDTPDIYAAESSFVMAYTQGDMSSFAATYKALGIDVDNLVQQSGIAPYTVQIGTRSSDNALVSLGYQATGGAMVYRRSIAKDVWGTDDPKVIQAKVGPGWDQFFKVAADLKAKGYGIVSGDGDIWQPIAGSSDQPWVVNNKLTIDPKRAKFLDYAKELKDSGYSNDTRDGTDAWFADMKGAGQQKIFSFFGPAWFITYMMAPNCGGTQLGQGTYGDWAVCQAPVGFFWGGTWILANKDTKYRADVAKLIQWITLDSSNTGCQYLYANGKIASFNGVKDVVASSVVLKNSNGTLPFLGGQNMFDMYVPANANCNARSFTQYDSKINLIWRDQVLQYTSGQKSRDQTLKDFAQEVSDYLGISQ